jgi:hypothetical protein
MSTLEVCFHSKNSSRRTSGRRFTQQTDTLRGRRWARMKPTEEEEAVSPSSGGGTSVQDTSAPSEHALPRAGHAPAALVLKTEGINGNGAMLESPNSFDSGSAARGWLASPKVKKGGNEQLDAAATELTMLAAIEVGLNFI